jgi:outer membrane protein OmpA-like peptidoglycan-associated protein
LGLLLATATVATAQSSGSFEITGFGRYAFFDDTLGLDDKAGAGGSLGFFFVKNLAIEAEGAYTSTNGLGGITVSNTPIRGRLSYHIPLGGNATSFRLGAGYVRDMYGKDANVDENGITGVAGFRLGLSQTFGVKLDGTIDYVPSPSAGRGDNYMNLGIQGGLSLLFGNSYDKDKDGVEDKADRCPGTPAGESVDSGGCAASQRDSDGDKVNDAADRCPNTASGQAVDAQGCSAAQKDADKDGVSDNTDRCPNTPPDDHVDQNGCGRSQLDTDGDGVADASDQCPHTQAGETVDSRGCGLDSDGDKVPDVADKCPDTPRGHAVDPQGCPVLFEPGEKRLTLQGVVFETGKSTLTPESQSVLLEVAKQLAAHPEVRVQVAGYTDNSGSRKTNIRISQERAVAVEHFLESNGVSPAQLTAKGFGPDNPVAPNNTTEGRAQNRRVDLIRLN